MVCNHSAYWILLCAPLEILSQNFKPAAYSVALLGLGGSANKRSRSLLHIATRTINVVSALTAKSFSQRLIVSCATRNPRFLIMPSSDRPMRTSDSSRCVPASDAHAGVQNRVNGLGFLGTAGKPRRSANRLGAGDTIGGYCTSTSFHRPICARTRFLAPTDCLTAARSRQPTGEPPAPNVIHAARFWRGPLPEALVSPPSLHRRCVTALMWK